MGMKRFLFGMLFIILSISFATASSAQKADDPLMGIHFSKRYDLKTEETLSGEVTAVEKFSPGRGGPPQGLRLMVKFPQETLLVILGPIVYVEQQNVKFAPGDRVEVKGSKMTVRGKPIIVAAEVKKGDQALKMRNAKGEALWLAQ
jgi:hypothetical protein